MTLVSDATPHFWREMQMKTLQVRQVNLSRLCCSLGRFARFTVKLGGRLVASVVVCMFVYLMFYQGETGHSSWKLFFEAV